MQNLRYADKKIGFLTRHVKEKLPAPLLAECDHCNP